MNSVLNFDADDFKPHEECGVFGVYSFDTALSPAYACYNGLLALQHRGQESCGIAVSDRGVISYSKDLGLVNEVFNDKIITDLVGEIAISHVRYSTAKQKSRENAELGGKAVTISGPDGYIYDADGITGEKVDYMLEMRASGRDKVQDYADKFGVPFYPGEKPWNVKVDVVMPCATQNEIGMKEAEQIVANGIQYYIEVSNMPTTNEAMEYLQEHKLMQKPI